MSRSCPTCGCPTSLPRKCAECKRIETVENRAQAVFDGGTTTPDHDPDPRNDIIRHIAGARRSLNRSSARNHQERCDMLDRLIRQVRHDRIDQATLKNELRAHYTSDDVEQVEARYDLRSAAQHAARYQPKNASAVVTDPDGSPDHPEVTEP